MKIPQKSLAFLVLGFNLFIVSRSILDMFLTRDLPYNSGNPVTRLIFAINYSFAAMVMFSHPREVYLVLRRNWFLVVLVLLTLASCFWTGAPALVLRRSVAVFGTTLIGVAIASRLSVEEQIRLLSRLFRIMSVLSLGCVLLFPSLGIAQGGESPGTWQGIFGYKNALGAMMAVSILVEWHRPADSFSSKLTKWLALMISAILLVFSNSITPMVALVGALFFIETYKIAKKRLRIPLYAIVVVAFVIVVSAMSVFLVERDNVTNAFGRSSNLSGRTAIWSLVLSDISLRPVLGYGYSGFWYGSAPQSLAVDEALGEPIMYSHNGYLETLLNIGGVGLLLTLVFLGVGLKRSYDYSEGGQSSVHLWPLAFLSFFILYNMAEVTILLQDLQWALCVTVVASADGRLSVPCADQEEQEMVLMSANETA